MLRRGFSLLEMIVVLSMLTFIASFSTYVDIDEYRRALSHAADSQSKAVTRAARDAILRGIQSK